MFEGSLVESQGRVITASERWTALGSMTVQCAIAGLLIAVPLMHPEALQIVRDMPRVTLPVPVRRPPPQPVRVEEASTSASPSYAAPSPAPATMGRSLLVGPLAPIDDGEPVVNTSLHMGGGPGLPSALTVGDGGVGSRIVVATPKAKLPVHVSDGVTKGMLLAPIEPVYPRIAIAARIEGTVVMEAIISKAGRIESLRVVSGSPMLQNAALEAVRAARYRPYLLNGEPTEVQTTISVNFRIGS